MQGLFLMLRILRKKKQILLIFQRITQIVKDNLLFQSFQMENYMKLSPVEDSNGVTAK